MNIQVHDYDKEETFPINNQELVNVDYDDKSCMTLYTKQVDGKLFYVTLSESDIKMVIEAFNNGPLA